MVGLVYSPAHGQERDTTSAPGAGPPPAPGVIPEPPVSPGGAFFRSLLVPGWGHTALGAYTRGGFYVATEAATAWMLVTVSGRTDAAEAALQLREEEAEARIRASGVTQADSVALLVQQDPDVQNAESLIRAREQQFEDWLALGIFLVLLGGADAYVSAHLYDFPTPVDLRTRPLPDGGVEVGVSVPVGGPPGRR